jgi:hypothetical protein
MTEVVQGARPIQSFHIKEHLDSHLYQESSLEQYARCWRHWLTKSSDKCLSGLDNFLFDDYTHGTSQTFDHFVLRHAQQREIVNFRGDFKYHSCISKKLRFRSLAHPGELSKDQAMIISVPFSDYGRVHPDLAEILGQCNVLDIPVCLDLAYWGISKNQTLDLDQYPCVQEVTSSLSKSFYTLENHRVGIRFSRRYLDDGISMINEVKMQNLFSMSLAVHYMESFDADWNWKHHGTRYQEICDLLELDTTDTIIFGTSAQDRYARFNRGTPGHHRVCISPFLKDDR